MGGFLELSDQPNQGVSDSMKESVSKYKVEGKYPTLTSRLRTPTYVNLHTYVHMTYASIYKYVLTFHIYTLKYIGFVKVRVL